MLVGGGIPPPSWKLYSNNTFSSVFSAQLPVDKYESTVHLLADGRVINIGGWTFDVMVISPSDQCLLYFPNVTGIVLTEDKPAGFRLGQNYQNPFNPATNINYSIEESGFVTLKAYDILEKQVAVLVNENKHAGNYTVEFNAANLPSAVYIYRFVAGSFVRTRKMLLLK